MNDEQTCPECHGAGIVHADNGFTWTDTMCERCQGEGTIVHPLGEEKLTREELQREN